jgi:hypothetical protein
LHTPNRARSRQRDWNVRTSDGLKRSLLGPTTVTKPIP